MPDRTLPSPEETVEQTRSLPQQSKGSLVDFADALNEATRLANKKRRKMQQELLGEKGFVPGEVEPSTFASILRNLEQRSTSFTQPLTESALDAFESAGELNFARETINGQRVLFGFDDQGNIITRTVLGASGSGIGDGGRFNAEDFAKIKANLRTSIERGKPREELMTFINDLNLPSKDELELLQLLDQLKPIEVTAGDVARQAFGKKIEF